MALATWWANDPFTELPPLADFKICPARDDFEMARINQLSVAEVLDRRRTGHLPYLGYMGQTPVTYGWVATREASIGELNLTFSLPAGELYLWDFATLPGWRGRGLYPRLLQGILQAERASRYWIIYAPENFASGVGIRKAGFQEVGQLSFAATGRVGLAPSGNIQDKKARAGASLLGVPLFETGLSPCWGCAAKAACDCKNTAEECRSVLTIRVYSQLSNVVYVE